MKELRTTEDILNDRRFFSEEQADKIRTNVDKEVAKIRAGRKPAIEGCSRNKVIKVSDDTKEAINYAYSVGVVINLEDIKLLQYAKEHGLTLSKLQQA
ncbi:hypothetical protein IJ384_06880 [bacterium]|nr:hypothetical protein [bacterium]